MLLIYVSFSPCKKSSMICFTAFKNIHNTFEVMMQVTLFWEGYVVESVLHYRQTTNILWIQVHVLSHHIIWLDFLCVLQM